MKKRIVSERQREANRRNGKLGGPKTDAGKEITKQNARKHDLTSVNLILSIEDQPLFEADYSEYREELHPVGIEENDLVEEVVTGRWRQKRAWGIETALFELAIFETEDAAAKKFETADKNTQIAFAMLRQHGHLKSLDLISRYEGRVRRIHERARKDLEHVQASKMSKPVKAPIPRRQVEPGDEPPVTVRSMLSKPEPNWISLWKMEPKSDDIQPEIDPIQPEIDLNEEAKPPKAA